MTKFILIVFMAVVTSFPSWSQSAAPQQSAGGGMLVRICEIELYPHRVAEYLQYVHRVGASSVRHEPGVICICPMQMQRDSNQIRILEIYRSAQAYREHIESAHFQQYKRETLHMVKSLDRVDMNVLDPATLPLIFMKMAPAVATTDTTCRVYP